MRALGQAVTPDGLLSLGEWGAVSWIDDSHICLSSCAVRCYNNSGAGPGNAGRSLERAVRRVKQMLTTPKTTVVKDSTLRELGKRMGPSDDGDMLPKRPVTNVWTGTNTVSAGFRLYLSFWFLY
uniref:Uncharacterized protein n=1 Tax=Knipowitschia caucasica TaxID=637954 RepID=A0AAV2M0F6_KNICA